MWWRSARWCTSKTRTLTQGMYLTTHCWKWIRVSWSRRIAPCVKVALHSRKYGPSTRSPGEDNPMKLTDFKATEPLRRASIAVFVLCASCVITFGQNSAGQPSLPSNGLTQTQQNLASATGVAQDASVADKWTTVYGAKIHYLEAGSGPAVILSQGLGGNTTNRNHSDSSLG